MMNKTIKLLAGIFLGILPLLSTAQNSKSDNYSEELKNKIDKIFKKDVSLESFKDSVSLYQFLFEIKIVKSKNNQSKVISVSVSDSLGYKFFPTYKELYSMDYSLFLRGRSEAHLIIPVLVYVDTEIKSKFKRQDDKSLVDVDSVAASYDSSFSSILPLDKIWLENVVLFKPRVIRVYSVI